MVNHLYIVDYVGGVTVRFKHFGSHLFLDPETETLCFRLKDSLSFTVIVIKKNFSLVEQSAFSMKLTSFIPLARAFHLLKGSEFVSSYLHDLLF